MSDTPLANECCLRSTPAYSGFRTEGDRFSCSGCGAEWVWTDDEADGGGWEPVDDGAVCEFCGASAPPDQFHPYWHDDGSPMVACNACAEMADE